MKYLKIDDNKGYFFRENAWVPIDQIGSVNNFV